MALDAQTFGDEPILARNPGNVDNEIGGARHDRIYDNRYAGCSAISSAISTPLFPPRNDDRESPDTIACFRTCRLPRRFSIERAASRPIVKR